jgi:hypothetical protein
MLEEIVRSRGDSVDIACIIMSDLDKADEITSQVIQNKIRQLTITKEISTFLPPRFGN